MRTRLRAIVAGFVVLALIAVLWFSVFHHHQQPSTEQPNPPQEKTIAERLVGSWKQVQPERKPDEPVLFEIVHRFRADGTYELDVWDALRGPKVVSDRYQVQGDTLQFLSERASNPSPTRDEIWAATSTIESLTDEQLVIVTVTKKRWAPERARVLAEVWGVSVEQLLSEVREERHSATYERVK